LKRAVSQSASEEDQRAPYRLLYATKKFNASFRPETRYSFSETR
jgi:hypothetical protein